jgi:hypothetical protein
MKSDRADGTKVESGCRILLQSGYGHEDSITIMGRYVLSPRSNDGNVNSLRTEDRDMDTISNSSSAATTEVVLRTWKQYSDHS